MFLCSASSSGLRPFRQARASTLNSSTRPGTLDGPQPERCCILPGHREASPPASASDGQSGMPRGATPSRLRVPARSRSPHVSGVGFAGRGSLSQPEAAWTSRQSRPPAFRDHGVRRRGPARGRHLTASISRNNGASDRRQQAQRAPWSRAAGAIWASPPKLDTCLLGPVGCSDRAAAMKQSFRLRARVCPRDSGSDQGFGSPFSWVLSWTPSS